MRFASRHGFALGLALVISASGCALTPGRQASDVDWRASATAGPKEDGSRFANFAKNAMPWKRASAPPDSPVDFAVATMAEPKAGEIQQTSGSMIEAPFKAISSGIKSGAEKVSEAFTPPVEKATDPTSLSNMPTPTPQLYVAMARLAEQGGRIAEAEQRYRQALDEAPDDLGVLVGYARLKDRHGDADAAIEIYQRAIKAHPDNAMVHNDLGLCLARSKKLPEALASLSKAVELDRKQVLYRNNIATLLVEMGNADAAYTHLAAVHPPAVAYYNVGFLLYKKGQPQAAASLFAQALRVDPSFQQAQAWLNKINGSQTAAGRSAVAQGQATGQFEDPTVEAPDLRVQRRQPLLPSRRGSAAYGSPQNGSRETPAESGPMPRITSPQAGEPRPLLSRPRQLPPILESNRRQGVVVPQSWEDAPLPPEPKSARKAKAIDTEEESANEASTDEGTAENEPSASPAAAEADSAAEPSESPDAAPSAEPQDSAPGTLPNDAATEAAPLP